ncbi:uncharacterized protein O3C94_014613 [Discoglossus pictus]
MLQRLPEPENKFNGAVPFLSSLREFISISAMIKETDASHSAEKNNSLFDLKTEEEKCMIHPACNVQKPSYDPTKKKHQKKRHLEDYLKKQKIRQRHSMKFKGLSPSLLCLFLILNNATYSISQCTNLSICEVIETFPKEPYAIRIDLQICYVLNNTRVCPESQRTDHNFSYCFINETSLKVFEPAPEGGICSWYYVEFAKEPRMIQLNPTAQFTCTTAVNPGSSLLVWAIFFIAVIGCVTVGGMAKVCIYCR